MCMVSLMVAITKRWSQHWKNLDPCHRSRSIYPSTETGYYIQCVEDPKQGLPDHNHSGMRIHSLMMPIQVFFVMQNSTSFLLSLSPRQMWEFPPNGSPKRLACLVDLMLCQLEFWLMVGLTMLDRLWGRGQTKCNTPRMLPTSVFDFSRYIYILTVETEKKSLWNRSRVPQQRNKNVYPQRCFNCQWFGHI